MVSGLTPGQGALTNKANSVTAEEMEDREWQERLGGIFISGVWAFKKKV